MNIKVEISKDRKSLVITMPLNPKGEVSASGKSLVVASTRGNMVSDAELDGKPIVIGVNAYLRTT